MVVYKRPEALSSAQELTSSLISAVQDDKHGFDKVQQLRALFRKHQAQHSNQARATAVKYLRHFARVHSATDAREELMKAEWCENFKDVCLELEAGISLEIPRMPFRGDETHDLICKVVRNLKLTVEDTIGFKTMFSTFFYRGVSILRFQDVGDLKIWKTQFEEREGYLLKQDKEAFFLEPGSHGPTTSTSNLGHCELFGHVNFLSGKKKTSKNPGGWWGLPEKIGVALMLRLESEPCRPSLGFSFPKFQLLRNHGRIFIPTSLLLRAVFLNCKTAEPSH